MFFFFKQKTAYEMRISDWSSDVCSSDLRQWELENMFARTERLLLRPGWQEDAPALARAIGEEAVVRNLARAPWPYGEEEARKFLSMPLDPNQPRFLIFARTGGAPRLDGGCGLSPSPESEPERGDWIARRAEERRLGEEWG